MDPGSCPRCGGPNPLNSTECQWCKGALVPPRPPFVERRPEIVYQTLPAPETYHGSSGFTIAKLVVIAILLVSFVGFAVTANNTPQPVSSQVFCSPNPCSGQNTVEVTGVVVTASSFDCGLNGADLGAFSTTGLTSQPLTWVLPMGGASLPCTVSGVTSNTPGFSPSGNLPETVTMSPTIFQITVFTPVSFTGVLNLTFQ